VSEVVFLDNQDVFVSDRRLVIQGHMYAMANVTSVRAVVDSGARNSALGCGAFWGLVCFLSLGCAPDGQTRLVTLLFLVVGVAVVAGLYHVLPIKYVLVVCTAGSEIRALWSHDARFIQEVVDAVHDAVIHRG
jgi:Family of unknown function (DUF6232)